MIKFFATVILGVVALYLTAIASLYVWAALLAFGVIK
jgi:hypothetical protein